MFALGIWLFATWFSYTYPKLAVRGIFLLLPLYLVRLSVFSVPTTMLEMMILGFLAATSLHIYKKGIPKRVTSPLKKSRYRLLFFGLGAILVGAIVNTLRLADPVNALGVLKAFYIEPVLFGFALWYHHRIHAIKEDIFWGLVWSGGITGLYGIYQKATGFGVPYAFWENRETYRITGWWGFPNAVGMYLAPIVPMAIARWKKTKKSHYLVFTGAMIASIFFAKSTGALVGLAAAAGLFLLAKKKTRIPTVVSGVAIALLVLLWSPLTSIKQELLLQDYSGNLRKDIWRETGEYLQAHWWLGAGLEQYPTEIAPYRTNKAIEIFHHPHNMLLTYWVETGLLGALGYLCLMLYIASLLYKNKKKLSPQHYALVIFLIMGLVDSPHIKNDLAIVWVMMLMFGE